MKTFDFKLQMRPIKSYEPRASAHVNIRLQLFILPRSADTCRVPWIAEGGRKQTSSGMRCAHLETTFIQLTCWPQHMSVFVSLHAEQHLQ